MNQLLTVLQFEYMRVAKSKSFLVSTIVLLVLTIAGTNFNNIVNLFSNIIGGEVSTAAIIDPDEHISDYDLQLFFDQYEWTRLDSFDYHQIEMLIEDDSYSIVVHLHEDTVYLYQRGDNLLHAYAATLSNIATQSIQAHLMQQHGLTPHEITELQTPVPVNVINVVTNLTMHQQGYVQALVMILYVSILSYGGMVLSTVVSEKSSKAMEVLITSSSIKNLMFGKVFGVGLAGLTQMTVLGVSAMVILWLNAHNWFLGIPYDMEPNQITLNFGLIAFAVLFFLIGYFIYAFIYAGLGSMLSKIEDASSVTALPTIFVVIGLIITMNGMFNPNTLFIRISSFVPLFTPMVMFMRIGLTDVPTIEIVASIIICLLTIFGLGIFAAKMYQLGVMMYGEPPKLKTIISLFMKTEKIRKNN